MAGEELVLSLEAVTKSYAGRRVVDRVTFSERRGRILGLVGPNGAGKTTLIRIIMGIVAPEEGSVQVLGAGGGGGARPRAGYPPPPRGRPPPHPARHQQRGLYQRQTVRHVLRYLAKLKGVGRRRSDRRMGVWLERLGVPDVLGQRVRELSKGMQQKVQFVATVLHDPDLLLLDEPFSGLDPVSRQQLRSILQELAANGKTILLSSHEMAEVELLCPEVVMIHLGQIVLSGFVDAIKEDLGDHAAVVQADAGLEDLPEVVRVEPHGSGTKVHLREGCEPSEFLGHALAAGVRIEHFELALPSLEDIFVQIVNEDRPPQSPSADAPDAGASAP